MDEMGDIFQVGECDRSEDDTMGILHTVSLTKKFGTNTLFNLTPFMHLPCFDLVFGAVNRGLDFRRQVV